MEINNLLDEYFNNLYMDGLEYDKLIYMIAESKENQKYIIDYAKKMEDGEKRVQGIIGIMRETYGLYSNEYNIDFSSLYSWGLRQMFHPNFYDYSFSSRFSSFLVLTSGNRLKVFKDIINRMDVKNPLNVQIAICSTYGQNFFQYEEEGKQFLSKVLQAIEANTNNQQIIADFNWFLKKVFSYPEYKEYKKNFKKYFKFE